MSLLSLSHLSVTRGKRDVLADVSLDIGTGECVGLIGPNGAGKTTIISMITGLLEPDGGRVVIDDGASPGDAAVRARIGVAPQALALYDDLTGDENVRFRIPPGIVLLV